MSVTRLLAALALACVAIALALALGELVGAGAWFDHCRNFSLTLAECRGHARADNIGGDLATWLYALIAAAVLWRVLSA